MCELLELAQSAPTLLRQHPKLLEAHSISSSCSKAVTSATLKMTAKELHAAQPIPVDCLQVDI